MNDDLLEPRFSRAVALRLAGVGAAGLALGVRPARAKSSPSDAEAVEAAARAFLQSLAPAERARASFAFGSAERTRWHWTVPSSVPRNGLPLGAMSAEQRGLALALLRASSSTCRLPQGAEHHGVPGRARTPGHGHRRPVRSRPLLRLGLRHAGRASVGLAASRGITSRGTSPSSATRSSPSRSSSAPGRLAPTSAYRSVAKGYRTMPREEDAAREIVLLLDGALRKRVVFSQESLTDHLTQNAVRVEAARARRRPHGGAPVRGAATRGRDRAHVPREPSSGDGAIGARAHRARRRARPNAFRVGGQHPPRRASLLPAARADVRARVRQLPKQRDPHPQRLARLRAGLRAPPALGGRLMTEIQRYLAEEIAEDHADGFVSRREALRRLGLLGLSGAAAASLLGAAVADQAKAAARQEGQQRRNRSLRQPWRRRSPRGRSPFAGRAAGR